MTDVLFYHLERARLEAVLPDLLEKTLAKGWKAVVRTGAEADVKALDDMLWTWRDDSFLPHGAGDPNDAASARQPVWLTDGDDNPKPERRFVSGQWRARRCERVDRFRAGCSDLQWAQRQ